MKRLVIKAFLLMLSVAAYAQTDYNVESIPAPLKIRSNSVIREMQTTVDMRSQDNVSIMVKKVITILNKNGDDDARLVLHYDKNTSIKSAKGQVLNSFGITVGKFTLSQFNDESAANDFSLFEDSRVKHYLPNVISYPYTIVYEYEVRHKQNLLIPDWYANPNPQIAVESNVYTFICKPEDQIRIKEYNFKGSPEELKDDKQKSYTWKVNNIPASKYEAYSPDPDSYLTYVKIAPVNFTYYKSKGNYNNWNELGKWIYSDLLKDRLILPESTIQYVKDLVKDCKDDKEKAKKIYEYVQQKTRYISVQIGIGGFQPIAAAEVDRVSYGDCKALVNYTQSLLNAVQVPSYYCVVYAGSSKRSVDADFASMDQANHVILCMPFKNDTTWLECTSQKSPFGYLGSFTEDRIVLACTPEGGKLLRTPKLGTDSNLLKRTAKLSLLKDGNIQGQIYTNFSGSQYENYEGIVNQSPSEKEKLLKKEYDIDNIDFTAIKLEQDKGSSPVTKENLDIVIRNYAPNTGNRIYLTLNVFNKIKAIPEVSNRTKPVYINRGFTDEDQITYTLPEGCTIESKPENAEITGNFGKYILKVSQDKEKLTYYRKLVINDGLYKPEDYQAFHNFMSKVSSLDQSRVILSVKQMN